MLKGLIKDSDMSDGAIKKIWLTDGTNRYLYKQSKIHNSGEVTFEHVSELLAMKIADMLGVSCVSICISNKSTLSRVMSTWSIKSFIEYSEEFSHSYHLSNLQTFDISSLLNKNNNKYWMETCEMLLFDALIGNYDRHPGNFAYTEEGFYPLYDNGSSLLAYVKDSDVHSILKDRMRFDAMCLTKSKPVLRVGGKLTHFELINILKEQFHDIYRNFAERVNSMNVIDSLNNVRMSDEHATLLKEFLDYRIRWFS